MASIEAQLKKIIVKKVKMKNGLTLEETLKREADRLRDCIQARIDDYYENTPEGEYKRTYRWQGSLYAEDIVDIRIVGNRLELSLLFHPSLANHPSLFGQGDGYVPALMNDGWTAKKLERRFGVIEGFTRFEGIHYIENGIDDFNKTNTLGIHILFDSIETVDF